MRHCVKRDRFPSYRRHVRYRFVFVYEYVKALHENVILNTSLSNFDNFLAILLLLLYPTALQTPTTR